MLLPLHNKVVVERIENQSVSSGGIILNRTEEPDRAKVIATGPKADEVFVGDVVLLDWNKAVKCGDYFVITVDNIIMIYGD
jgi:co-chaperonin GroES (HSP10)